MSEITVLNSGNFDGETTGSLPVLVDFYADWCGPCKMLSPVIDELAGEYAGKLKVCKLNVDDAQDIASRYGVMSIPTLILFKNGEEAEKSVGLVSKNALEAMIKKYV